MKNAWKVGSAVCCLTLGAILLPTTWLLLPPRPSTDVPLPRTDAPPDEVVTSYLNALAAHDCETASALTTGGARQTVDRWCSRTSTLRKIDVGSTSREDPTWSGHRPEDEVVRVPVRFTLQSRPFRDDVSLPDGAITWGYLLTRDDRGRWRIFDQGVG